MNRLMNIQPLLGMVEGGWWTHSFIEMLFIFCTLFFAGLGWGGGTWIIVFILNKLTAPRPAK